MPFGLDSLGSIQSLARIEDTRIKINSLAKELGSTNISIGIDEQNLNEILIECYRNVNMIFIRNNRTFHKNSGELVD